MDDPRIQKVMLLLLSSTESGEIVAARDTLLKLLADSKTDIHTLVGLTNGLSEAEMKKLYNAGYDAGARAVENRQFNGVDFCGVDGLPNWEEMARYCQVNSSRLRDKERNFVDDMAERTVWHEPTEKQAKWLKSIFLKLGGVYKWIRTTSTTDMGRYCATRAIIACLLDRGQNDRTSLFRARSNLLG
jgi:hypothetical protein